MAPSTTNVAPGGTRREPLAGVQSQTGVGTLLAKYESGTYGLPHTDGVDVGKYSFITKGKNGGSVGEFVRWMVRSCN